MGLETGTTISQLDSTWPVGGSDQVAQGDDHLRLIKAVLKAQFPGAGGTGFNVPIIAKEVDLNALAARAAFSVRKSVSQVVSGASSYVDLDWGVEIVDNQNAFATNQYTIPTTSGGLWLFGAYVLMLASQDNVQLGLKVNGAVTITSDHFGTGTTNGLNLITASLVSAGDVIKTALNTGTDTTVTTTSTQFWGFKII